MRAKPFNAKGSWIAVRLGLASGIVGLAGACSTEAGESPSEAAASVVIAAAPLLPADYRRQTFPVEAPLVLEYPFGGAATNKARLSVVNYPDKASDLFFFHLHSDEKTAKKAGEDAVRAKGGTLMYLSHAASTRDMTVTVNGTRYTFDPNRIFTATGLEEKTNPKPRGRDLEELRKFVDWVTQNVNLGRAQRANTMVTALHNNTDDDTPGQGALLSIRTERDLLNVDNRAVNANASWNIDNFYIATLPTTYDAMVQRYNPNISLRLERPRDIGYISNWMITQGIDYLNVEVQHGDVRANDQMIEDVQALFH